MKFRDLKVGEEFFFNHGSIRGPFRKTHLSNGPNRWEECWYLDKNYWAYFDVGGPDQEVNKAIPEGEE